MAEGIGSAASVGMAVVGSHLAGAGVAVGISSAVSGSVAVGAGQAAVLMASALGAASAAGGGAAVGSGQAAVLMGSAAGAASAVWGGMAVGAAGRAAVLMDSGPGAASAAGRGMAVGDAGGGAGSGVDSQMYSVECKGIVGVFYLEKVKLKEKWCIQCSCTGCSALPEEQRHFSGAGYEKHAGMGSSKKWKESIKYLPGRKPLGLLLPK